MLDMFSFMCYALAGRFRYESSHHPYHSAINVYCGSDHQFSVSVNDAGYEVKELNGTVLNKGKTFVEYAQFLKDNGWLNSGFEV